MDDALLVFLPLTIIVLLLMAFAWGRWRYNQEKAKNYNDEDTSILPDELILLRRIAQLSPEQFHKLRLYLYAMLLLLPAIFVSPFLMLDDGLSIAELASKLEKLILNDPQILFVTIMFVAFPLLYPMYLRAVIKHERLVLNREGVSYYPPGISLLDYFMPGWHISWTEITRASINNLTMQGRLSLQAINGKTKHILINQWDQKSDKSKLPSFSLFAQIRRASEIRQNPDKLLQTDLLRYIKEKAGIDIIFYRPELEFDLFSNVRSRNVLVVIAALIAYTIIDAVANMETYLVTPQWIWFVAGGVIASGVTVLYMRHSKVPAGIITGLSVMLGVVFAVALYPGLLRINQLTDPDGIHEHIYTMAGNGVFENKNKNMPAIKMKPDKYWKEFETGQKYSFSLRKGGLGFYQIDMDNVYKKMRQWYCKQDINDPHTFKVNCD